VVHLIATFQTPQRIFYQQEVHIILTAFRSEFAEQASIEDHRLEKQHLDITQPGGHRVAAAMKQGHAKASLIVERKHIPVRPLHGIDVAHGKTLQCQAAASVR